MNTEYFNDVDDDYFQRRSEKIGKVLPVAIDLNPGEHLRDAALRAISLNGYNRTKIVVEFTNGRSFKSLSALKSLSNSSEIESLVDFLGIRRSADHLRKMFSNMETGSRALVSFFGQPIARSHFATARRVAPSALKLRNHQRAVWAIKWIGFDPESMEMLIDRCPSCAVPLGWETTYGPSRCGCCRCDLRDYPQPTERPSDGQAVRFFVDTVDPETSDYDFWNRWSELHPELSQLGRGELFQFAVQTASRFDKTSAGWGRSLNLRSIERAGRAILEWPNSFDQLLAPKKDERDDEDDISALCSDPTLSFNLRSLLKERKNKCLERVVVQKVCRSTSSSIPSAPIRMSGPMRRGRVELRRLTVRAGEIHAVEAAVAMLRSSPKARGLARDIGLPVPHLVDLHDEGLLPELDAVLGSLKTATDPHFNLGVSLLDQLEPFKRTAVAREAMPLFHLAFALGGSNGKQWNRIFKAIIAGTITVAWRSGMPLVHNLYIPNPNSLARVLSSGAMRSQSDFIPLSQADVAAWFGRSRATIHNLVRHDLMPPNPTGIDVAEFRKNWMFLSEVRDLAFLNGMALPNAPKLLAASSLARVAIGDTTIWSRVGVQEHFGLSSGSMSFVGRNSQR